MRCHFLTAVWGSWHTDKFVSLSLPSLLAEKNLPSFARRIESRYYIHTTARDAATIKRSGVFQALRQIMHVRLITHDDRTFGHPVATHTRIWLRGVGSAKRRNAFIAALPADMVWADSSFDSIAGSLEQGRKAIYAMFIRVVSETFIEEFARCVDSERDPVRSTIAPRQLMALTMRHIHPLHASYLRDSEHFPFHAEYILWPAGNEGFVLRSLATTTLMFHAGEYAVNSQFSLAEVRKPEEVEFLDDSDVVCGVSLTPLEKDAEWYFQKRRADLDEIGGWWLVFDGAAHLALASHKFRFHQGEVTQALWRRVESESDFFVTQAVIAREIIRVGRALREADCGTAAKCVATALYAGRLRRHWRWRGPVTVFAPVDDAFTSLPSDRLGALLAESGQAELREFLLAHVAAGSLDLKAGATLTALNGGHLAIEKTALGHTVNGQLITGRRNLPDGSVIYRIYGRLAT